MIPNKVPTCYGLLFESQHAHCDSCLLRSDCKKAMENPRMTGSIPCDTEVEIPKDKKLMILAICRRYGVSTAYFSRKDKCHYEVTKENMSLFSNLDFLLTTKEALAKLLQVKLEVSDG